MTYPEESQEQRMARLDLEAMRRPFNNSRAANLRRQQENDDSRAVPAPGAALSLLIKQRDEALANCRRLEEELASAQFVAQQHLQTVQQQAVLIAGYARGNAPYRSFPACPSIDTPEFRERIQRLLCHRSINSNRGMKAYMALCTEINRRVRKAAAGEALS